jgi:hypothetical protein
MLLNEWIKNNGLKKSYLAEKLGIKRNTLFSILRWCDGKKGGQVGISPDLAARIACFTGGHVSVQEALFPFGLPDYPTWEVVTPKRGFRGSIGPKGE